MLSEAVDAVVSLREDSYLLFHPTDNFWLSKVLSNCTEKLSISEHQISLSDFPECVPKSCMSEHFVICSFFQGIRYPVVNN